MTSNNQPLKIDKDVPLPHPNRKVYAKTKRFYDALEVMEIGDSIAFTVDGFRGPTNQPTTKVGEISECLLNGLE